MGLGIANRIAVVKSNSDFKFDRRLTSIRYKSLESKTTIANLIRNRSIFDINRYKLIIINRFRYKFDLLIDWIDQMSIIQWKIVEFISKIVEFNREWSNLLENGRIWSKKTDFQSNLTIFDLNWKLDSNSDRDFEVRFEFRPRFPIETVTTIDRTVEFG